AKTTTHQACFARRGEYSRSLYIATLRQVAAARSQPSTSGQHTDESETCGVISTFSAGLHRHHRRWLVVLLRVVVAVGAVFVEPPARGRSGGRSGRPVSRHEVVSVAVQMALAVVSAVPVSSSVTTRVAVGRRVSARAHAHVRAVFFLAPAAFCIVAVVVVAG
ncbi:unnamed protein product, partial [Ectocarpus sp. 12 AP-2014]